MAKIALNGAPITQTTASGHITYRTYDYIGQGPSYCNGWNEEGGCTSTTSDPIYEWRNHTTSATVKGTVTSTISNVSINGKAPIVSGDRTLESDTYSLPSGGVYVSGQHSNTTAGRVTSGNNKNVYANGKLISVNGATVSTHAGTGSSISGGASTSVNIGS